LTLEGFWIAQIITFNNTHPCDITCSCYLLVQPSFLGLRPLIVTCSTKSSKGLGDLVMCLMSSRQRVGTWRVVPDEGFWGTFL